MLLALLRCEVAFRWPIWCVYLNGLDKSTSPLPKTPIATLQKMPNNHSMLELTLARVRKSNAIFEPLVA